MKKNVLVLLFTVLTAASLSAQKTTFGAKAGLNFANVVDGTDSELFKSRTGFVGGFYANFGLTNNLSIQPELLYSSQGSKFKIDGITKDPSSGYLFENLKFTYKTDYLNIPVLLQYKITGGLYLQAGPQISFLVSQKVKIEAEAIYDSGFTFLGNPDSTEEKTNVNKSFDFGLATGLGYKFNSGLSIDARYNAGLTNIINEGTTERKNGVFQISIGYEIK